MKFTTLILLILAFFLVACSQVDVTDEESEPDVPEQVDDVPEETNEGECASEWLCVGDNHRTYRYENCSTTPTEECSHGCTDGQCNAAKECERGLVCISDTKKGFRETDCSWLRKTDCDWKCEDGECIERPENYTEPVEEEVEKTPVNSYAAENEEGNITQPVSQDSLIRLSRGETTTLVVDSKEYNITLYLIDAGSVQFRVNDVTYDETMEGDIVDVVGGMKITVHEILFAGYPGGKQEVGFTVG